MKRLLIATLAVLTIFVLASCEQSDPYDPDYKINYHGCPLEGIDYKHRRSGDDITYGSYVCYLNFKYFDKTNGTVSYLGWRDDLGLCYEVYNADEDGKPADAEKEGPLMAYVMFLGDSGPKWYNWAAKDEKKGVVYEGRAKEIVGSKNILKDSMMPETDDALNGWFCGYIDIEDTYTHKAKYGEPFVSFTDVFVWRGELDTDFIRNQDSYGIDTFNPAYDGFVDRISKLAAIPWVYCDDERPFSPKGMAISMDSKHDLTFEE